MTVTDKSDLGIGKFFANPNLWPLLLEIIANLDDVSINNCKRVSILWRRTITSDYMLARIEKRRQKIEDEVEEWQSNYAFLWGL